MNNIILIDDRKQRKSDHLNLNQVTRLLNCVECKEALPSFDHLIPDEYDFDALNGYDIIAIHRSYLAQNGLMSSFSKYMEKSKSYFILFSGGFSQNVISNKSKLLKINSIDFYSERTISFFEKYSKSVEKSDSYILLNILYGKDWKLPLLLRSRLLLWKYYRKIESTYRSDLDEFQKRVNKTNEDNEKMQELRVKLNNPSTHFSLNSILQTEDVPEIEEIDNLKNLFPDSSISFIREEIKKMFINK